MSSRTLGLLMLAAVGGLIAVIAVRPGGDEGAGGVPGPRRDGGAAAAGTSTSAGGGPGGGPGAEQAADEGPGAPAVPPSVALAPPDLTRLRPEARARLLDDVRQWLGRLREPLRTRDWKTLRGASASMAGLLPVFAALLTERVGQSQDPAEALLAGLLMEEHITGKGLTAAQRDALGAQLVPLLGQLVRSLDASEDDKHQAMRLLSRFPGEAARVALVGVLDDGEQPVAMRRFALFGLAAVGGAAEVEPLERQLAGDDVELARAGAMALGRIAVRCQDAALLARVRDRAVPRLVGLYGKAVASDPAGHTFGNLVGTVAELRGVAPAVYLATELLDTRGLPPAVTRQGLDQLVGWKATAQLPELEARRGRLTSAALNRHLEQVIARLRATPQPND